jgi:uncharacterized membrane protein YsdA (DUF1294 family)
MGLSLSTDFILGMLLGGVGMLLVQQLTRTTSSLGKFMPLLLVLVLIACGVLAFNWLQG